MPNWKDIHPDFTEELAREWEEKGFSYEEVKEWIDIGLTVNDADYVEWLKNVKKVGVDWVLNNYDENKELKRRYKKYGLCEECQQPNTGAEYYTKCFWCQSCNAKHFQQGFSEWTSGNTEIDEFIQKSQLQAFNPQQVLEWIPHEKLVIDTDKPIGEGHYGEVYKAKWIDKRINKWDTGSKKWERNKVYPKSVVLKALKDSKDITTKFLKEISYHKLFDDTLHARVVRCFGISRDPETKKYSMVMSCVEGGNLREYLENNYSKLAFEDKFSILVDISFSIKEIHKVELVHQDLHPGNILIRYYLKSEIFYTQYPIKLNVCIFRYWILYVIEKI